MKKGYNLLVLEALEFFIKNPYKEIHLREFSRNLKISPNSSQRFLNLFLKKEFIKEERKANLRYFRANLENLIFKHIKIVFSLQELKDSGLIREFLDKFSNLVLFGSMAKGLDDKTSDIDLVGISKEKNINLGRLEEKLGRQINLHLFSPAQWKMQKNQNEPFYQDVIIDGINLIGEVPVID